jgi:sulfoxide reductase heme-binding subunit YedZ
MRAARRVALTGDPDGVHPRRPPSADRGPERTVPQGGHQGRRLVRHHVPLALGSAVLLALFMTLPIFNPAGHTVDLSSGAFPQQRGELGTIGDGRDDGRPTDHREDESRSADHGVDQRGATDHGAEGAPTDHVGGGSPPTDSEQRMKTGSRSFAQRFTVATGYVATGLLVSTLLIGPANLLLRRRNPVSSYLRRDVGAWTAIASVVHVVWGLQVHGPLSDFLRYFVGPGGSPLTNSFGFGNWTGLAATIIVVGLLALSSDFALRRLRARRWKRLQRLNYALFALVVAHAFFYGALLRMTSPFTLLLGGSVVAVFAGQLVGIWLWRRRHSRPPASVA